MLATRPDPVPEPHLHNRSALIFFPGTPYPFFMSKLLAFIGMTAGGWLGWSIGGRFSMTTAFILSIFGTAIGLYVVRRVEADHF